MPADLHSVAPQEVEHGIGHRVVDGAALPLGEVPLELVVEDRPVEAREEPLGGGRGGRRGGRETGGEGPGREPGRVTDGLSACYCDEKKVNLWCLAVPMNCGPTVMPENVEL